MRRLAIAAVLFACLPAGIAAARQFVQQGTLRVAFEAKLLPHALPRERDAPVTVHLAGAIRTTDGSTPPQLREISIADVQERYADFRALTHFDDHEM